MISYDEARAIVLTHASQTSLEQEEIDLSAIAGRICAAHIKAPLSIQPFDNAAMDGFALRYEDLVQAAADTPVSLDITGIIAAGDPVPNIKVLPGQALRIMTGAPMPHGADAVVPVEKISIQDNKAYFSAPAGQHDNLRFAGEDFKKGDDILSPGAPLSPSHILPLATLGISRISVFKKPKIAFISTGRELVNDLSAKLDSGQIYNSNRPYAVEMIKAMGAQRVSAHTIADDSDIFEKTLTDIAAQKPDIIISSGAVSAGEFDFVRSVLEKSGAEILFHKIKLKPGKPNLFAHLPDGTLYFGLPGNPVATAAGLRFFVAPALRAMTGQPPEKPVYAKAMNRFTKKAGFHMFLKAQVENWEDGLLTADFPDAQASFMVSPFLSMNGWASIPEDMTEIKAGEMVEIYPLLPDERLI